MCERCQSKINVLTRKLCAECNRYFCHQCVSSGERANGTHKKSPQMCRRCTVFSHPVMERDDLCKLSVEELKFYQGIETPVNASKDLLIEMILGHQARILTERAQTAIRQLHPHHIDISTVDANTLQPPSTAYSTRGTQFNRSSSPSSAATATASIRSRIKQHMGLRKSTEVLDTSGIAKIEDLRDESQIDLLSVRQLKVILQRNCIDYRGCVEKTELMERVHRLYKEKEDQKEFEAKIRADGDTEAEQDYLCKVCMDSAVDCVFLNCGHMLTCVTCGRQLTECPVCRQYIVKVVHAFRV